VTRQGSRDSLRLLRFPATCLSHLTTQPRPAATTTPSLRHPTTPYDTLPHPYYDSFCDRHHQHKTLRRTAAGPHHRFHPRARTGRSTQSTILANLTYKALNVQEVRRLCFGTGVGFLPLRGWFSGLHWQRHGGAAVHAIGSLPQQSQGCLSQSLGGRVLLLHVAARGLGEYTRL
jgi:hypothetical protein